MDWFNNIGCEELESEAVTYFEQFIGSISEVLAASSNEQNVSDNGDSDIENDESDIDNTCDRIQARAREFYSTSVTQDQSKNTCTLIQNDELEDPSRLRINALFANDCNCAKHCFTKLSIFREQAYDVSLSAREFTKAERYIYLLSKLENLEITDSVFRGGKRERKRYRYSFQGVEICEFTWRNVYNIGRSKFKSLKQHLNENGVTPRSHGLSGRKSNRGHSFEVIENTIKFIKRFTIDEVGVVFARETLDQPEKRLVFLKESANLPELLTTLQEVIQPAGLTEERRRYLYNEVRPFVQFNFRDEFCPRASEE
ncbi:LSM14 [Mytilus coruscus]|uniref:LSM14 n=1 Tax=Mytilus coruscus TaxID=42192 RepID=A0A6J8EN29_MYTCO|nr:LSM14 [Mytilus coruscus]